MMMSSHLCLGLPLGLVVRGFHLNIFLAALVSGILCTWPNQPSLWMYNVCHFNFAIISVCLYTQFHRLWLGTSVPSSQETHWSPIKTNQSVCVVYGNNLDVQEK